MKSKISHTSVYAGEGDDDAQLDFNNEEHNVDSSDEDSNEEHSVNGSDEDSNEEHSVNSSDENNDEEHSVNSSDEDSSDNNEKRLTDEEHSDNCEADYSENGSNSENASDEEETNNDMNDTENEEDSDNTDKDLNDDNDSGKDDENSDIDSDLKETKHPQKDQSKSGKRVKNKTIKSSHLANVMNSLLDKSKKDIPLLSQVEPDKGARQEKRNKRKIEEKDELEVVDDQGEVKKLKSDSNNKNNESKKKSDAKEIQKKEEEKQKSQPHRHFPISRRLDQYCDDPRYDADVVKEKKLRGLATQGVVQLFNTLEKYKKHKKQTEDKPELRHKKPQQQRRSAEHAAIKGGKPHLVSFLSRNRTNVKATTTNIDGPVIASKKWDPNED